jgi:hypothetical protein
MFFSIQTYFGTITFQLDALHIAIYNMQYTYFVAHINARARFLVLFRGENSKYALQQFL